MGVMNRFKDMFKGEDEYDVDGYNDGYDSYDDVADEGGVNESVQAQPQPRRAICARTAACFPRPRWR